MHWNGWPGSLPGSLGRSPWGTRHRICFYVSEEQYAHTFDSVPVPYPASAFELHVKPDWIRQRLDTWHGIYSPLFESRKDFPDRTPQGVRAFENMVHAYWGTVLTVDDSVGQLLAYLKKSGTLEQTIVLFAGDSGLLKGEHGMVEKRTMHEPSIRIPLIVRGPGVPSGRTESKQVLSIDLTPSLLDLCGAEPRPRTQGRS